MRRTSLFLGVLLFTQRPAFAQLPPPASPLLHPASTLIARPGNNVNLPTPSVKIADGPLDGSTTLNETLLPFDPAKAEIVWSREGWKLTASGTVLKDFGKHESDARQSLRLIQQLGLNQYGTVGTPAPIMEYWLRDGQAPIGLTSGVRMLALDAPTLKVEQSQGQWVVRDRQRVWFNFATRGDEAQLALGVMQKYGFTQVGLVGSPAPAMMVLTANPMSTGAKPATMRPAQNLPADPSAALAGAMPGALPPLRNAVRQPNQPVHAFNPSAPTETLPPRQTSFLRGAPGSPITTDRVTFDYRQAQVRQEQGRWKVVAGTRVIGDFGGSEKDAKEALKAVQYFRLTEQHLVGGSTPRPAYYLSNGQAPHGIPFGVSAEPIDLAQLTVQQVDQRYAVVSGARPLMYFGERADDARQVAEVIQRYKFDHVCHVGPEETGLTVLVKAR